MSDSDDDDDFVVYGTAFEPLDEDEIPRKRPVTLEDQVVKDAQGRRRFHGAFTGGFSAGFFNTVGSLEGWTPSSFKSSRSERMESKAQRPEDFMDDEDTGEFGIAPKVLRATSDFSHLKRTRQRAPHSSDGPIPGEPVLKLLLEPVRETAGARLLRRMGWRPGQGVGPRVAPRPRRHRPRHRPRVLGCEPPPGLGAPSTAAASESEGDGDEDVDEEEEEEAEALAAAGVTFAPEDVPPFLVHPKADTFGLGYRPLARRPVLSSATPPPSRPLTLGGARGGKVSVSGQAFGVGALEEEDEDIYAAEDMSQYDFALGGPAPSTRPSAPHVTDNYLHNFVKDLSVLVKEFFPPPVLPKEYRAAHTPRRTRFDQPPQESSQQQQQQQPTRKLTTGDRTTLVGGEIDEEVKQEHERLRAAALKLTEGLPKEEDRTQPLRAFVPFAAHPDKQRRYEQYLALVRAGHPEKLMHLQPLSMSAWERQREKGEFEQAARLFRPLSADMGERFVSASQPDDSTNPMTPVEKLMGGTAEQQNAAKAKMFGKLTREEEPWQPCDLLCKRFNIAKPTISGATASTARHKKVSVFDFLKAAPQNTSQTKIEPPDALPAPVPSPAPALTPASAPVPAYDPAPVVASTSSAGGAEPVPKPQETASEAAQTETEGGFVSIPENIELPKTKDDNPQESSEDFIFPEPAEKIDLFKAIFLSSSESEDAEEEEQEKESDAMKDSLLTNKTQPAVEVSHLVASAPADVPRSAPEAPKLPPVVASSARSGVFANLDLDALSRPATSTPPVSEKKVTEISKPNTSSVALPSQDDSVYGPQLPTSLSSRTTSTGRTLPSVVAPPHYNSPLCEWVESTSIHKKKKEKKKKEKKNKEKKSKSSKHKKHKHSKK